MYPNSFKKVINVFEKFQGVGSKTATRYSFSMLDYNSLELEEISKAILDLKNIKKCKCCGFLSDHDLCNICNDTLRNNELIIVVENCQDLINLETNLPFKAKFHVLNGLISTTKGIFANDINIDSLFLRLDDVKEVVLALPSTIDGQITSLYIDKLLKEKNVFTTKFINGLPIGTSLQYADALTLKSAFENRKKVEDNEK